jgi:hypothetical protein
MSALKHLSLMGRLSDVTLGDLARGLGRYRPALVALVVLLVALQLLPDRAGRVTPTGTTSDAAAGGPQVGSGSAASTSTSVETPTTVASGEFSPSFGSFSSSDTVAPSDGTSDSSSDSSSSFTFDTSDTSGSAATTTTAAPQPLVILASAWATSTAGTPLAASGVPNGTLPVGKRVGQDDKRSFVRLTGTKTVLALAEETSGNRTPPSTATGPIGVRACQVTADWEPADGETFAQAPTYDASRCVAGVRSDNGSWRFDLASFFTRTDRRGFALVPTADAAVDFQVTFQTSALPS